MTATCVDCHEVFEPGVGAWHEVTGWVESRPTQGLKANAVRDKTFTGRVRCAECGKLRQLGVPIGQQALFSEGLF